MTDHEFAIDRRGLLFGGVTIFGGMYLLGSRARAEIRGESFERDAAPRSLLIVELSGGNDGISCIVPHGDDVYYQSRGRVGVPKDQVLRLDDYRGFHPNLVQLRQTYDAGKLAIVEGAGYPQPNHSHFTSQDIWHTARAAGRASGDGWVGRLMAEMYASDRVVPHAVHVGQTMPFALKSSTHPIVCFDSPPAYRWARSGKVIAETGSKSKMEDGKSPLAEMRSIMRNAQSSSVEIRRAAAEYKARVEYPVDSFAQDLKTAAALLQSGIGCRVLSVTQGGYDTHEDQPRRHDGLMAELDRGLSAFLADVRGTESGDNILVLVFSEFGRRVQDNASNGTDHGTAGPMFLAGTPVHGGLFGKHPLLTDLVEGDLIHTTDFRSVYRTVLEDWFAVEGEKVLGAKYDKLAGVLA